MIFLLAGTSDAKQLAYQIGQEGFAVVASVVTTSAARELEERGVRVRIGRMDDAAMCQFFQENKISMVVDASHPFAEQASLQAMRAAEKCKLPYIRYERPPLTISPTDTLTVVNSYQAAAELASSFTGNILLTTGAKTLRLFACRLNQRTTGHTYYRLLPTTENFQACGQLGIANKHILAMQGPFSKELNLALLKNYRIDLLITKDSGKEGSVVEKVEAARELGIQTIVIARPHVDYPIVCSNERDVMMLIKELT